MGKIQKTISFQEDVVKDAMAYPVSLGYGDFSYKINEMVTILIKLRRYTKRELSNHFELNEACVLIEITRNLLYAGELSPKAVLQLALNDACELDALHNKWCVDKVELEEKLNILTEFQAYLIISTGFEFWQNYKDGSNIKDEVKKLFITQNEKDV